MSDTIDFIELTTDNVLLELAAPVDPLITIVEVATILTEGIQGPPGPQGPPGSGVGGSFYYEHIQSTASALWIVNHNLGAKPNIRALTVGGMEMLAEVQQFSLNQARIYFDTAVAGTAICS